MVLYIYIKDYYSEMSCLSKIRIFKLKDKGKSITYQWNAISNWISLYK
jgi:hypothetical protein